MNEQPSNMDSLPKDVNHESFNAWLQLTTAEITNNYHNIDLQQQMNSMRMQASMRESAGTNGDIERAADQSSIELKKLNDCSLP